MSDISNSNSSSSSKRRLNQIDDTIEYLTQELNTLNDFVYKSEFECLLTTVKMKREKVKAVSAIAKSQVLLAKMEVLIAESDLFTDIERIRNRNFKRIKLDRNEGELQVTPAPTTATVSVQTIESMSNKKKKTRHSSSRSSVDISSGKTEVLPTIRESSASLVGTTSHTSPNLFSSGLFKNMRASKSDSEVSLSSSNKAEFHELYTKTQTQETVKKSSKRTQSPTPSPNVVADLKNVNTASKLMDSSSPAVSTQNSSTRSTYMPLGHNMGVLLTQPRTAPFFQVIPATQANIKLYYSQ